jgi:Holliday junction resolvase
VGIRFDRMDWLFLGLEDLERTDSSYRITPQIAKRKGLLFEELIR